MRKIESRRIGSRLSTLVYPTGSTWVSPPPAGECDDAGHVAVLDMVREDFAHPVQSCLRQ